MGRRVRIGVAWLACLGLLAGPRPVEAGDDEVLELTIGIEGVDVESFLQVVSRVTGVAMVWDPSHREIRGKKLVGGVSLRMRAGELLDVARALLTFYDLALVPVGPPGHQVQLVMGIQTPRPFVKWKPTFIRLTDGNLHLYEGRDGLLVTATMPVRHREDLETVQGVLADLSTGGGIGTISPAENARALVVTDFAPSVVAIFRLLAELDRPVERPAPLVTPIALQHARAAAVVAALAPHFAPETDARRLRAVLSSDEASNTVLVSGSRAAMAEVRTAVRALDVPARASSAVRVIVLKYTRATETAAALGQLIRANPLLWHGAGPAPSVVAHETRNALLVSAAPEALADIERVVRSLDVP